MAWSIKFMDELDRYLVWSVKTLEESLRPNPQGFFCEAEPLVPLREALRIIKRENKERSNGPQ